MEENYFAVVQSNAIQRFVNEIVVIVTCTLYFLLWFITYFLCVRQWRRWYSLNILREGFVQWDRPALIDQNVQLYCLEGTTLQKKQFCLVSSLYLELHTLLVWTILLHQNLTYRWFCHSWKQHTLFLLCISYSRDLHSHSFIVILF